jgi:signal transduction histidine kinase
VLQIVSNLLDNAFRWTPRKGTVTLSYATANSTAAIHISDTGPGIPAADQVLQEGDLVHVMMRTDHVEKVEASFAEGPEEEAGH